MQGNIRSVPLDKTDNEKLELDTQSRPAVTQAPPSAEERLLRAYEIHRREIHQQIRAVNRANLRGVVAIGAIIGYAVSSGTQSVVALVPVAMAYIFVKSVGSHMWVASLAQHIAEIEAKLSAEGSAFRWEIRRGGTVGREYSSDIASGLNTIPPVVRVTLATVGYVASILFVLNGAWPSTPPLGLGITSQILTVFYLLLTIVVVTVGGVYRLHVYRVGRDFEQEYL